MEPDPPRPPDPPEIERRLIIALVEHARAQSRYAEQDINFGATHGHRPHPQTVRNVEGWSFVALALAEVYDLEEYVD